MTNIYFVDIETVPFKETMNDLPENIRLIFERKYCRDIPEGKIPHDMWEQYGAINAEFGKVVCVSVGKLQGKEGEGKKFYVKTIVGKDESKILAELSEAIKNATVLCAHNGLEFDYPYLFRRYVINKLSPPSILNVVGKKVWDVQDQLLDTMKLWSHLQWKHNTSLELLAYLLGLPNPKAGEITGADVGKAYYATLEGDKEEETLKKIGSYCANDVVTLANVYASLRGYDQVNNDQVVHV